MMAPSSGQEVELQLICVQWEQTDKDEERRVSSSLFPELVRCALVVLGTLGQKSSTNPNDWTTTET